MSPQSPHPIWGSREHPEPEKHGREVPRRIGLPYRDFVQEYLAPHRPVVLTDATQAWPARSRWTPEFFGREFAAREITVGERRYRWADFVEAVLTSTPDKPAPYLIQQKVHLVLPELMPEISPMPEYFLPNWLNEWIFPERLAIHSQLCRGGQYELLFGGTGSVFPVLHYDFLGLHAFICQIHGAKDVVLYPPEQTPLMYPATKQHNISAVHIGPDFDLKEFPLFAQAVPTRCVLRAGETLFIPTGWWHGVRNVGVSIAVTINVANASNWWRVTREVYWLRRPVSGAKSLALTAYMAAVGAVKSTRDAALGAT